MNSNKEFERTTACIPTWTIWTVRAILPLVILGAAFLGFKWMLKNRPKHRKRPAHERTITVDILEAKLVNRQIKINANGTVIPARELSVKPRVSGQVKSVSSEFETGGVVKEGDVLFSIDPVDYKHALTDAHSKYVQSQYAYKLEMGQQDIARHEWELLPDKSDVTELEKELTLRKPHLKKAKAEMEAASSRLKMAELDLSRTKVKAPFNAVIMNRSVEIGSQVSPQSVAGTMVGSDEYWVEAYIHTDRLSWIVIGEGQGSEVIVRSTGALRGKGSWKGNVRRMNPGLDPNGRMAKIIVSVKNPGSGQVPLILGSFVEMDIIGKTADNVIVIPRTALHDGNTVWLMGKDGRLVYRKVSVLWDDVETAAVNKGLKPGDKIVITQISSAVPGMKLVLTGTESKDKGKQANYKKGESDKPGSGK